MKRNIYAMTLPMAWYDALNHSNYRCYFIFQVSFDSKVKFTAITVYPYNDGDAHHITKFRVQYSRLGIRWEYALDAGLETKVSVVNLRT